MLSILDGVGYRSPCVGLLSSYHNGAASPPAQGRSVREFEEQMANLRKENFNLKLRLYFMEESIQGFSNRQQQMGGGGQGIGLSNNSIDGQESIMKQLIDCKVEMEMLHKELEEKQEILKEAAQAMTQMEKIQKDSEIKYQDSIDELKQRIQYLEMERDTNALDLNLSRMESTKTTEASDGGSSFDINTIQQVCIGLIDNKIYM